MAVWIHDLRIAAIACSLKVTVVTRNQQDFQQIPQLSLADWTITQQF